MIRIVNIRPPGGVYERRDIFIAFTFPAFFEEAIILWLHIVLANGVCGYREKQDRSSCNGDVSLMATLFN